MPFSDLSIPTSGCYGRPSFALGGDSRALSRRSPLNFVLLEVMGELEACAVLPDLGATSACLGLRQLNWMMLVSQRRGYCRNCQSECVAMSCS